METPVAPVKPGALIGKGHSGKVFHVKERDDKQNVKSFAMKEIKIKNQQDRESAEKEIELLKYVTKHEIPYVAQLRSSSVSNHEARMTMRFANGGELFNIIKEDNPHGLPEGTCRRWFTQLMLAIRSLYHAGILHRDHNSKMSCSRKCAL